MFCSVKAARQSRKGENQLLSHRPLIILQTMTNIFHTHSEEETIKLAKSYAKKLIKGDIVFLEGTLGAGKSVFARSLIREVTQTPDLNVPSPTFTLLQTYTSSLGEIYHYDLYRLKSPDEIYELEWEEALNEGIVLLEWPQKLKNIKLHKTVKHIHFSIEDDNSRKIILSD